MVPRPQLILLGGWLPVKGVGRVALRSLAFCQGELGVFLFLFSFLYFQPLLRWFLIQSLYLSKKKYQSWSSRGTYCCLKVDRRTQGQRSRGRVITSQCATIPEKGCRCNIAASLERQIKRARQNSTKMFDHDKRQLMLVAME